MFVKLKFKKYLVKMENREKLEKSSVVDRSQIDWRETIPALILT